MRKKRKKKECKVRTQFGVAEWGDGRNAQTDFFDELKKLCKRYSVSWFGGVDGNATATLNGSSVEFNYTNVDDEPELYYRFLTSFKRL